MQTTQSSIVGEKKYVHRFMFALYIWTEDTSEETRKGPKCYKNILSMELVNMIERS